MVLHTDGKIAASKQQLFPECVTMTAPTALPNFTSSPPRGTSGSPPRGTSLLTSLDCAQNMKHEGEAHIICSN